MGGFFFGKSLRGCGRISSYNRYMLLLAASRQRVGRIDYPKKISFDSRGIQSTIEVSSHFVRIMLQGPCVEHDFAASLPAIINHHEATNLIYDQVVSLLRCDNKKMKARNRRTCWFFWSRDSFHFTFFALQNGWPAWRKCSIMKAYSSSVVQHLGGLVSDGCARSSQSPSVTERLEALRKSSDGSEGGVVGRGRRSYRCSNTWRTRFCVTWLRKNGSLRFWQVLFNATQLGGFTYYKTVRVLSIYWTYIDLSLYTEITQVKTYSLLWMMWPSWCRFSLGPVSTQ